MTCTLQSLEFYKKTQNQTTSAFGKDVFYLRFGILMTT